ncbi:OLC1v1018427C2 [Oldenlandia corymbosa var. corymbosa]|uniref:OLC1v1018427C2 n=1 Tax=Oldenlandia corymbosa var. corymbosa TaxID=529605 RepID=A0AAV1EBM1_OLDCO|nr:OLC1v1018427C2 [Oldenlandia corymbosa var. corymbosa]
MTQMINTESISNGVVEGGVAIPAYKQGSGIIGFTAQDKQPQGVMKKTALRDVQNQCSAVTQNHHDNLGFLTGGGSNKDNTVKVCGTKRLTPERPSTSPLFPTVVNYCENEHVVNARRRFDLELGSKANFQSSINKFISPPQSTQSQQLPQEIPEKKQTSSKANSKLCVLNNVPSANSSFGALSGPNFQGKISSGMPAMQAVSTDCNVTTDEQSRAERYITLQKFLKECDQPDYSEAYLQGKSMNSWICICSLMLNYRFICQQIGCFDSGLRHLSPAELSRRAQDLESRLYKLAVDDCKGVSGLSFFVYELSLDT